MDPSWGFVWQNEGKGVWNETWHGEMGVQSPHRSRLHWWDAFPCASVGMLTMMTLEGDFHVVEGDVHLIQLGMWFFLNGFLMCALYTSKYLKKWFSFSLFSSFGILVRMGLNRCPFRVRKNGCLGDEGLDSPPGLWMTSRICEVCGEQFVFKIPWFPIILSFKDALVALDL